MPNSFGLVVIAACCLSPASAELSANTLRGGGAHAHLAVVDAPPAIVNQPTSLQLISKALTETKAWSWSFILVLVVCCWTMVICSVICWACLSASGKAFGDLENSLAESFREKFDKECPEEEKPKYSSKEFKAECDKIFEEADADHNGTLDVKELKGPVKDLKAPISVNGESFAFIMKAFDRNGDSEIDKTEFFELMKLVQWQKDTQEAKEKAFREKFDKECPEEEKPKYSSKEFKAECDKIFEEADTDHNGTLDVKELQGPVKDLKAPISVDGESFDFIMKAFDVNGDSEIDKAEFFELMKLVQWQKDTHDAKEKAEKK